VGAVHFEGEVRREVVGLVIIMGVVGFSDNGEGAKRRMVCRKLLKVYRRRVIALERHGGIA